MYQQRQLLITDVKPRSSLERHNFCKMLREGKDILFINDAHIAFNGTIYSTDKGNNGDRR